MLFDLLNNNEQCWVGALVLWFREKTDDQEVMSSNPRPGMLDR